MLKFSNVNCLDNFTVLSFVGLVVVLCIFFFIRQRRVVRAIQRKLDDNQGIEKRYTQLVHLLPQTVIEVEKDGKISFLNDAGKALLELSKFDLQRGTSIFDLIVAEQRERFFNDFMYLLEGGLKKGQEYLIETRSGKQYPITIYFTSIQEEGEIKGLRGIIIDISRSKKLEREALGAVMDTEERERKRFSEDLHDGLGPLLSTIKLYINQMNSQSNTEVESKELLQTVNELIDEAIGTTRHIANNILPGSIRDNGLWPAIESFCRKLQQTGTMNCVLENKTTKRLRMNVESNVYRILIELINNTIKHARAGEIKIRMWSVDNKVHISYSDNGIGFSSQQSEGMGLINIKNRSAALNGQYEIRGDDGMHFELILPAQEVLDN